MSRRTRLGLVVVALATLTPGCRAVRARLQRTRPAAPSRALPPSPATATPAAPPPAPHLAPDTVTVRIGTPGTGEPIPDDTMIDPRMLRLLVDSPYQNWSDAGTFVHVVAFAPDQRPCPDADVYIANRHIGRTDAHGTFAFRRTPSADHDAEQNPNAGRLLVICRRDDHRYVGVAHFGAFARTSSFERPVIYAYTDRGVYNPGQTLHARAIAWRLRGEYEPLAAQTVTLSLRREDGTALGGGPLTTDDYGVGTLDIALPEHLAEGRYTLVATSGEETAEAQIRVQRFVPPVIEIEHTLGEFLTPAMHEVPFDVTLHYFDGAPFTRGHVVISAKAGDTEIPVLARDVTGAGPHHFVVPGNVLARVRTLVGDRERMEINVAVADPAGRSDTLHRPLQIATNPYTVTIELDRQGYAPGERVDATVRVVDLNHVVVRGKHVELHGLAHTVAGDTDTDGVVHFRFPMPAEGRAITAWVPDVGEAVAETTLSITTVHPMQSTVAQTTLREREPVDVTVRFPANVVPVEDVVHADVVDSSGAIIDSFLIPIDRSGSAPVGRLRFDAPSWGSMLLTLFTTAAPRDHLHDPQSIGLVTDGQSIAITPGATLDIQLDPLPAEARPGERVHVNARILRNGQPVDARVGAAVVDQAVISLLDPLEHDPRDRFYNPQQKVLAETGSQTLTWPVVQRTWGSDRYDIGWPASFGFHDGGDPGTEVWSAGPNEHATAPIRLGTLFANRAREAVSHLGIFAALGAPGGGEAGGASGIVSPFGGLTEGGMDGQSANGNMTGDTIGDAFGYGGLGATGTGWGGGGTGEGTIGLGSIGTMGHGAGRRASAPPRLVLRTNFAETAAWLPSLEAHEGHIAFDVDLPDSITRQQVSLLATDRHGGIAVARAEIPVRQSFYVRSDLPPTLVEGDTATVGLVARNLGDAATHATLQLDSNDIRIEPASALDLDIDAHGSGGSQFHVTATHPGRATYHFAGTSPGLADRGERTLFVQPAGIPMRSEDHGVAQPNQAFALTFDDAGDRYDVHTLSIAFPTAVALTDVLAASDAMDGSDIESVAAELDVGVSLMSVPALATADRSRTEIHTRATRALIAVLSAANPDGGFGWWWGDRSNATTTAFVLDVLEHAASQNLSVPPTAMQHAAEFLINASRHDALLSAREVRAWEGDGTRVRDVLTAEVATVLAALPHGEDSPSVLAALALEPRLTQIATRATSSPLEIAHALRALAALDMLHTGSAPADRTGAIARLLAARRERHWEPGWFDAFGGGIETTAVALDALAAIDPMHVEALRHDAVEYLLASRSAWGEWHNVRGTAWAIRALSRLPLGTERSGAHVHAEVDGRVVADLTLDSRDPWAATLALRTIELTDLARGPHRVTVAYDGTLAPTVTVTHERWNRTVVNATPNGPSLSLVVPESTRSDAPLEMGFDLSHAGRARAVRVSIPIPPYADPDAASLRALVANGTLAGFEIGPRAIECIVADPLPLTTVRFRVSVPRAGHFTLTGAYARIDGGERVDAPAAGVDVM